MAWRAARARQPPRQMDSEPDHSYPMPFARLGPRCAAAGAGAGARQPPPRHAPESDKFTGYDPPRGNGRWNDFVQQGPSTGWHSSRRGAHPRWSRWKPANPVNNDDDSSSSSSFSSSSSSSSSDDEPEFRDMDIVIDGNRIMNANGTKIVTGLRVKRDLMVRISNNKIGS